MAVSLTLLKYHGLGNDFLIALDPEPVISDESVRRLCDRRRGIGADGVIVVGPPRAGGDVSMVLRNSDGGRAETSGNGLRCLALALADSGRAGRRGHASSDPPAGGQPVRIVIETDGGPVIAMVGEERSQGSAAVQVSMGRAVVGPLVMPAPILGAPFAARSVDTGNPHLVILGPSLDGVDVATIGPVLERSRPGGQNVEVVAPDGIGGLDLVVWERGAGLTEACGSGSCASAAAARAAGLVGDRVPVHNPGGVLVVELSGSRDEPEISLIGPACRVGEVEVDSLLDDAVQLEAAR